MGENDVKALYDFLVGEGYDLSSIEEFKGALSNDGRRKQVYDFFTSEGFDMGEFENFRFLPSSNVPGFVTGERQAIPQGIAAPAKPKQQQQFNPMAGVDLEAARQEEAREPQYFTGTEAEQFQQDPRAYYVEKARERGLTRDEVTLTPEEPTPAVQNLSIRMGVPDNLRRYTDQAIQDDPNLASRFQRDENITERELAGVIGNSIARYGTELANDLRALQRSVDPVEAQAAIATIAAGGDMSQFSQRTQDYAQMYMDYSQSLTDMTTYLERFPNERDRLADVRREIEANRPSPDDTFLTKVGKNTWNAVRVAKDRVLQTAGSLLTTAKGLVETGVEFAGGDTSGYDFTDRASEEIANWYDDNVRSYIDTQVIKDGKFQGENLIPALAGTMTDMALLLGGGQLAGRAMGSATAGLIASGYATTFGNFYNEAVEKGLEPADALTYAHSSAFVQGVLETVSPNTILTRNVRGTFRGALDAIARKEIGAGDVVRTVLREIGEENLQEVVQGLSEKAINAAANEAFGTDFSDTFSRDELLETIVLTTAATGLVTSIRAKGSMQQERDASLKVLRDRRDEFDQWLQSEFKAGRVSKEEVLAASGALDQEVTRQAEEIITPTEDAPQEQQVAQQLVEDVVPDQSELLAALDALEAEQTLEDQAAPPEQTQEEQVVTPQEQVAEAPAEASTSILDRFATPTDQPAAEQPEPRVVSMRTPLRTIRNEEAPVVPMRSNLRVLRNQEQTAPSEPTVEPTKANRPRRVAVKPTPEVPAVPETTAQESGVPVVPATPPVERETPTEKQKPATFSIKGKRGPYVFKGTPEEVELVKIGNAQRAGRKVDEVRKTELEEQLGKTASQAYAEAKRMADKEPAQSEQAQPEPAQTTPEQQPVNEPKVTPIKSGLLPDEIFYATDKSELSEVQKKDIEVGSFVEYDGRLWYVTKKDANGFSLTSNDRKARAKGVTPAEVDKAFKRQIPDAKSGDKIIWEGREATVTIGDEITLDFGDRKKTLRLTDKNLADLADGKSSYARKEKLQKAGVNLKRAADELFKLKAFFDPKSEADAQVRLAKALESYIKAWISYNGSLAYSKFKRSLPSRLSSVVSDEDLRTLFENSDEYKKLATTREESKERQFDAALGNVESAGAKNFIVNAPIDQSIKDEIKRKGLNYFAEPRQQTDDTAKVFIATVGLDEAVETFLEKKGLLPPSVEMFVARNLIRELNAAGRFADAAKVALEMIYRGREIGRALNAFVGLSMLTPEGLQIATNRFIDETRERLKPRYQRRVDRILRKYEASKREAEALTFQTITDIARREEIKAGLKRAGQELREVTSNLSSAGILDPRVWIKFIQYGKYLILDGAITFKDWASKFQQAHRISEEQLEQLWNTKIDGKNTLADMAKGTITRDIQMFLNDRTKLEEALVSLGIYDATRLAKDLHDKYRRNLASQFKKKANRAEVALVQVIEQGDPIQADKLMEQMMAEDGFKGLDTDIEQKLASVSEILAKSPVNRQKELAVADLMQLVFQKMGKVAYGEYYMFMLYANMLFGVDTHFTNVIAGSLQAGADVTYGAILRPFTEMTQTRQIPGASKPLLLYQASGRKAEVARETLRAVRFGVKRGAEAAKDIVKRGKSIQVDEGKYPIPDLGERARSFKEAFAKLQQVQEHLSKKEFKQAARALFSGLFGTYANINKYSLRALTAEDMLIRTPVMFAYMVRASEYLAGLEVANKSALYEDVRERLGFTNPDRKELEIIQAHIADELRGWKAGEMNNRWQAKLDEVRREYGESGVPLKEDARPLANKRFVEERITDLLAAFQMLPSNIRQQAIRAVADRINIGVPASARQVKDGKRTAFEEIKDAITKAQSSNPNTIKGLEAYYGTNDLYQYIKDNIETVAKDFNVEIDLGEPDIEVKVRHLSSMTPEELQPYIAPVMSEWMKAQREAGREFFEGPQDEDANIKKERQDRLRKELIKKLDVQAKWGFDIGQELKDAYDGIFAEEQAKITTAPIPFTEADVIAGALERFPQDMRVYDMALKKSTRSVFNNPPEGILGVVAASLNQFSSQLPTGRIVVPFTNLLANVLNMTLDYNPLIGIPRLLNASPSALVNMFFGKDNPTTTVAGGGAWKRDFDEQVERRYELLTRMTVGLVASTMAAALLAGDDEDGFPLLTGQGPIDWTKNKKWRETHKPFSIRIGDTYVSYQNWPISNVLAFFGNYFDIMRYGSDKQKEKPFLQAAAGYVPFVLNNAFISGLSRLFDNINKLASRAMKFEEFVAGSFGSTAGQMVPFANLMMDMDKATNTTDPWLSGWQKFYTRIPFVRHLNTRPMLDQFGEPMSTKAYDNAAANALYKGLGGERFFAPTRKLTDLEKMFVKYDYITPTIQATDDPYRDYDLNMLTRKLFARMAAKVSGEFSNKEFEDRMDGIFKAAKAQIKSRYEQGRSTEQILQELGMSASY